MFDDYASIAKKEDLCNYNNRITPIVGYIQNNLSEPDNSSIIYNAQKCVYTVIKVEPFHYGVISFSQLLYNFLNYIKENNYEIIDDLLAIKLLTLEKDFKQYDYYELYFPIKSKN